MVKHDEMCDWHTDQYDWECSCGAVKPVKKSKQTDPEQRATAQGQRSKTK